DVRDFHAKAAGSRLKFKDDVLRKSTITAQVDFQLQRGDVFCHSVSMPGPRRQTHVMCPGSLSISWQVPGCRQQNPCPAECLDRSVSRQSRIQDWSARTNAS